jgi:hypothetical protein
MNKKWRSVLMKFPCVVVLVILSFIFSCASSPDTEYDEVSDVRRGFTEQELRRREIELEISDARQRNPFIIAPPGPSVPVLPEIIDSILDMEKLLAEYEETLEASAIVYQAVLAEGWRRNEEGIQKVQLVTQWWREYFAQLTIFTDPDELPESFVQEQLEELSRLDGEFSRIVQDLNEAIEATNQETSE